MSGKERPSWSSPFRVILIMAVLTVVGAACIPLLNVQYAPVVENRSLTVNFSGNGSARVMEAQVASVLEGALNTVEGVENIRAVSGQGSGYISMDFKKGTDMETARFDISTRIRQIRKKLPEGTSVGVSGSAGAGGRDSQQILRYTINADMPAIEIVRHAQEHLVTPLSRIDGVEGVSTSGATPFEWVITFNPDLLRTAGLTPQDLSMALSENMQNNIVGTETAGDQMMLVRLRSQEMQLEDIPVGKVDGRMYRMGDLATITYREQTPSSYSRINGLNTINLYVTALEGINTIAVADAVKDRMQELCEGLPDGYAVRLSYDASEYLNNEIHKIFMRALMSLAILLLFVLLVSRSFRYLTVIGLTVVVNLLGAVAFYRLLGVDIELYSMAGITVSLGIIIDTAIVIADHCSYYGNRRVMFPITGALLTTIASLLLIFFLPVSARQNLTGFIWVIVINLTLSIAVAFLFVPALLHYLPLKNRGVVSNTMRRRRRLVRMTARYGRVADWGRCHRWACLAVVILLFGIPLQMLPTQVKHKDTDRWENETKGGLVGLYNKTIGGKWYQHNKIWLEYTLGGTLNLFQKHSGGRLSAGREEEDHEVVLRVQADLAEGQNVQQLNAIVMEMENWLQQFDQISDFYTNLSGTHGSIEIHFRDGYGKGRFPYELKQQLWAKAIRYGGATWSIPALDQNDQYLSNSVYRTSWANTIPLYGYNYDLLYRYAEELIDSLKANRRVNGQAGFSASGYGSYVGNEFFMELDQEKIVRSGTDLQRYLSYLGAQLHDSNAGIVHDGQGYTTVRLASADRDGFDLWHIRGDMVQIDSVGMRLSELGNISKRRTGMNIERQNQEYVINVGYEFIGSYELQARMRKAQIERMNKQLPMGFHAGGNDDYAWWGAQKQQTALIFVVVLIIFMICASLFESFRIPLVIVLLIPVSFMGMFLAYPLLGVSFGQGGFAAMIMLCGITVNAGIYLTSEYRTICQETGRTGMKSYTKAFNRKIIPTLLTIGSTVLGLIPFLIDGRQSQFWFSFAVGVMSGMIFSIAAIVLVMPVFFPLKGITFRQSL